VDTTSTSSIREGLEPGNQITVTTADQRRSELTVVQLSDVAMEAEDRDGQIVTIPYDEIVLLEVREPRPGRTAAAAAGGIAGVYALFYGLALAALLGGLN